MDLHAVAIRKFLGPLWAWREKSSYLNHHRQLEVTQYDSPQTIQARQFSMLRALLAHAYETVPFYRNQWRRIGLHPADIDDFGAFRRVPILISARTVRICCPIPTPRAN